VYAIILPEVKYPVTHMLDTTVGVGLSTYSGRRSQAELIGPASQLIGHKIDSITIRLKMSGTPAGNFEVGVFNADLTTKQSFGLKDASTLTTTYTDYTFSLAGGQLYTIAAGDRVGIKYLGGNITSFVAVMTDNDAADPFDGQYSYHQYYTTAWQSFHANDLYMILKETHG
jgi:hypothetical protein